MYKIEMFLMLFSFNKKRNIMEETHECVICWSSIDETCLYQKWNCTHRFHQNCISNWNNGCPTCRNQTLVCREIDVAWSISRNPQNVLDLSRMLQTSILPDNYRHIYTNNWKDRDCIDQNHHLWYFDNRGVQVICEDCNSIQCFNRQH